MVKVAEDIHIWEEDIHIRVVCKFEGDSVKKCVQHQMVQQTKLLIQYVHDELRVYFVGDL